MGAQRINGPQQAQYWELRKQGFSIAAAAKQAGFSEASGKRLEKLPANGQDFRDLKAERHVPDLPVPLDEICDEAKAALEDRTGYLFVKRYMGLELMPWQQQMWSEMEDSWEAAERRYLAVNGPPGGGKSTVGVGFAAKLVVQDRSVRTLFISRASTLASKNTRRLRRLLERPSAGEGAESTLSTDFGRFKPKYGGDVWTASDFVVEQMDGSPIDEKESTCQAFGFEAEWLGHRIDFVFGDDLDSNRTIRNMDVIEKNRGIFDDELEPRLEPGGLFMIAQQRLGAFDFSNHVLSKMILPEDDGTDVDPQGVHQYRRLIFRAHYEDRCRGVDTHKTGALPYPDGCLLQPIRLSWRDLRQVMHKPTFKTVYQQEDPTEDEALVKRIWVDGGRDQDGRIYLGCWDKDRGLWELPGTRQTGHHTLVGDILGVISVDPSPTRYWGIQAWAYHPSSEQRFLLDLHRERMDAPDFLDWSPALNTWTGLLEDWWQNYQKLGVQLSHVVVEINAAQRFMLQYDFFHRWMRARAVNIIGHSTQRNKTDPELGIQMLAPRWEHGQVRLPGEQTSRIPSMRLVDEVLRYPHSATTDCVMSEWFFESNLDRIYIPTADFMTPRWRPSWLRKPTPELV